MPPHGPSLTVPACSDGHVDSGNEPARTAARAARLWLLGLQYGRFVLVGLAATLVHVLAYVASIELWGQSPLAANAIGFALGVNLSFVGHRRWTFAGTPTARVWRSRARFCVVALTGFGLNSLFVELVTGMAGLGYGWSIPLIGGVTPVVTFALSKRWAFGG